MSAVRTICEKSKKFKKGDEVIVIAGKDCDKRGKILKVLPRNKLVVEGINLKTKHEKPNPQKNEEGGRKKVETPLDLSNVAIWNPALKKADRVGFKFLKDGKKVRIFKGNGELIDA